MKKSMNRNVLIRHVAARFMNSVIIAVIGAKKNLSRPIAVADMMNVVRLPFLSNEI